MNTTTTKPLVNVAFAIALRNAAEAAGDVNISAIADAAICGDRGAADSVGAIMHGATWWACLTCRGSGKQGRRKCAACGGACTRVPQVRLDELRNVALRAITPDH